MDGGGRVSGPLTTGFSGRADARPAPRKANRLARWLILPPLVFRRRGSFVSIPLNRRLPRLTGTALVLGFFGIVGLTGAVLGGQYDAMRLALGEPRDIAARTLGLGIERITITGLAQLTEREVLEIAGISPKVSLPFVSAAEIRTRLEKTPLVAGAVVRKLFPNELAVTLVERQPYALWQRDGQLFVIAADGTVIDTMRDARFASLPLVVGDSANVKAASYRALLEAAGPLASEVRAGMLVSGRRWTLKMQNGLDVRLPEEGAAEAVRRLVRLEREERILDKDVLAVDLRMPDRVVVRLTEDAAAAFAEAAKKKPKRGTKGIET